MRGAKPKVYPPLLVAKVADLYAAGLTQHEVAESTGLSQKIVWNLMRRHGLSARVAAKRDQRGTRNSMWRGGAAGYAALHLRVAKVRGKPCRCEDCGVTEGRFEWANLTGRYQDTSDYRRLCRSCHSKLDGVVRNLGAHARRKEVCP